MKQAPFYQVRLQEELVQRLERRSNYSLRALASSLDVDAGALSRILSGKKVPTYKLSLQIFKALGLSPEEQNEFLSSVAQAQKRQGYKRTAPELKKFRDKDESKQRELSMDVFRVISDWYHYAILELTFTEDFQSDPIWISQKLRISKLEAKLAIDRLLSVDLLQYENGRYKKTDFHLTTADKAMTTSAHKKRQKQVLEKAIDALESEPIHNRSNTAMTMAIDPSLIPIAKKKIEEFTNEICSLLESGNRTRVYEFSMALFPLDKERK